VIGQPLEASEPPSREEDGAAQMGARAPLGVTESLTLRPKIGVREYSRRSPPSLSSHLTGPEATTGSERAIGVWRSSPRCGRAWL